MGVRPLQDIDFGKIGGKLNYEFSIQEPGEFTFTKSRNNGRGMEIVFYRANSESWTAEVYLLINSLNEDKEDNLNEFQDYSNALISIGRKAEKSLRNRGLDYDGFVFLGLKHGGLGDSLATPYLLTSEVTLPAKRIEDSLENLLDSLKTVLD